MKEILKPVYIITGKIIHGRGIGKCTGTPTANIDTTELTILPEAGVYTSEIYLNSRIYYGVTHTGIRPTLDNEKTITIETHIFDFNKNIYGEMITVKLYKKIRNVKKFAECTLLIEQIKKDCMSARQFWGLRQNPPVLYMDRRNHQATLDENEIHLSQLEFQVLHMLYESPKITFSKKQIYEEIWKEPANEHLHAVENTVFQIRQKLRPYCSGHDYIKTISGSGYKFNGID